MDTITPLSPSRPALAATDKTSFAYTTTRDRWPVIITKVIDGLYQTYHSLNKEESETELEFETKQKEAKAIIEEMGKIKYQLQRDKPLIPLEDDGESDVLMWHNVFNTYFHDKTWYSATWLFTECYLYRLVHSAFAKTKYWRNYDPFARQKEETFKASFVAVSELAKRINELTNGLLSSSSASSTEEEEQERRRIVFHELAQVCLWGNATDLSLLTNLSGDDVEKLQRGGRGTEALKESEKNILANDLDRVWEEKLKNLRNGRIDFVLDNAGFELYVDMVFADWLIQAGYASEIHFHAKRIPWFVSDTTPADFHWLLSAISNLSSSFSTQQQSDLTRLSTRWSSYLENKRWILHTHQFWTSPYAYWHLPDEAPDLFADICKADLVLLKGDLNYRKLVYDCKWEFTTPFVVAIGPLATIEGVPAILALRTCKADVIVGLPAGVEEKMEASGETNWLYSGKYAVVQYSLGKKDNSIFLLSNV
ncbi:5828_t:CDS:2 [Ambispora gerdemannii]|uniref:Sugar phosphate phosphatase n=1 Tax=Ambispora gerdemannii TaxID=144530 RepID=A0A9N8VJJ1_9GLOM|nr:5828_t:CDS:2 [Ambispora gerdemannii]